jgi:hypothetical protein
MSSPAEYEAAAEINEDFIQFQETVLHIIMLDKYTKAIHNFRDWCCHLVKK